MDLEMQPVNPKASRGATPTGKVNLWSGAADVSQNSGTLCIQMGKQGSQRLFDPGEGSRPRRGGLSA